MSAAQLSLTFATLKAARRCSPAPLTWRACAESAARYRSCVRLDLGRAWACEWPWEPGDSATTERVGPERRPCPLCEIRWWATRVIATALHAEAAIEQECVESASYLAWLESDRKLMRTVERTLREGSAGMVNPQSALSTALVMARQYGSADAALEELRDDAYAMDSSHFDVVRRYLRVLHLPKREATALLSAWARAQEAA